LIEVDGLSFRYAGRKRPALRDVTFSLGRGESLLVLGPSGGGKSTLALCLNGAIPHFIEGDLTGTVRVGGTHTRAASMAELAQRVGLVFQDPESQFCMLKVDEEVAFGLENLAVPRDQMRARIADALQSVGLADREHDRIDQLSGGQKQRLALACVLAQRPEVLVFDEPTAQLDPAAAADIVSLLAELRARGAHTLIVIEHRLDELMHLIDKVLVLGAEGNVVAFGHPREVMRDWCAWLTRAGVWVPQVSELASQLQDRGLHLDRFPLTVAEAAEALRPHFREHALRDTSPPGGTTDSVTDPPTVQTRSLTYSYSSSARRVLSDVSIEVRSGELTAIAGANGAGKSTLARHLVRILRPKPSTVWLEGRDVRDFSLVELTRCIGYVFQYPEHQFIGKTLLEDVAFGLRRVGVATPEAELRATAMLARFGLERLAPASPFTLSHGEQRRLSVASMLVLSQRVLLLDEPTFGQDRRNSDLLLDELSLLAAHGAAIVSITHDMRLVAERAARVLVMADGQLAFDGPPDALFANRELVERARLVPPPLWQLSQALRLREPMVRISQFLDIAPVEARLSMPSV
jgi:energy-coupling factor transport system ATP-binding protein